MLFKIPVALLAVALVSQVVLAENQQKVTQGPPPRFLTVKSVEQSKKELVFDVQIVVENVSEQQTLLVYPDGYQRMTLEIEGRKQTKPTYVHHDGFRVSLQQAKWIGTDGNEIDTDDAAKRLKPGMMVLLSSDGAAVDRTYLGMFKEDNLVLLLPPEELPVPFFPHTGGGVPIKKVDGR